MQTLFTGTATVVGELGRYLNDKKMLFYNCKIHKHKLNFKFLTVNNLKVQRSL